MNRLPALFRWLTLAALADWLITRTLTRVGVFIPKSPAWIAAYQGAAVIGQGASTLAGLFALVALGWAAWQEWQSHRKMAFPIVLVMLAGLSLLFLFVPAVGWLAVVNHLLLILAYVTIFWRAKRQTWLLVPMMALVASSLYQLFPAVYETLHMPGPPSFTMTLFNLGEICVVLSGFVFGWVVGQGATRREWILAAIPSIAFAGMFISVPAMAGIFSIWSLGLTLFLPWPFYMLSIWATGIATLVAIREKNVLCWGILLLAAGGYASQLSTQTFYSVLALWLLAFTLNDADDHQNEAATLRKPTKFQANLPA